MSQSVRRFFVHSQQGSFLSSIFYLLFSVRPCRTAFRGREMRCSLLRSFAGAFLLALSAAAQDQKPPATLAELQQRLKEHIEEPKFAGALWGAKIVSLDTGKTIFEHNPQKLFSP